MPDKAAQCAVYETLAPVCYPFCTGLLPLCYPFCTSLYSMFLNGAIEQEGKNLILLTFATTFRVWLFGQKGLHLAPSVSLLYRFVPVCTGLI